MISRCFSQFWKIVAYHSPNALHLATSVDEIPKNPQGSKVHASLQALLPAVKVHRGQFGSAGIDHVDIPKELAAITNGIPLVTIILCMMMADR